MRFFLRLMLHSLFCIFLSACNYKANQLNLRFDRAILKQDVRIRMQVLASVPITEIYDGKSQFTIPDGYGENEWFFTYEDSLQGYFRHMKTNRNDQHRYNFTFHQVNGKFFVDIDIKGISPLSERVELNTK